MVSCMISSPLISFPDCIFIGPEPDHCLGLSIKFLKLKFGRDSGADLLKLLKSNYFGKRTHTLAEVEFVHAVTAGGSVKFLPSV